MSGGNPNAINDTDKKPMKKKPIGGVPGNQVRADQENDQPENRFNTGWDPEYRGYCHSQTKQG